MTKQLLPETPSQTAGPYVHIGLALAAAGNPEREVEILNRLAASEAAGEHIRVVGRVFDGNGHLMRDAFLEFWQADSEGNYQTEYRTENSFNSFGRAATLFDTGEWERHTVKPAVPKNAAGVPMAPHLQFAPLARGINHQLTHPINVALFARGINIQLQTRIYFEDEAEANAADPVLGLIEQPERRLTLVASRCTESPDTYRFDIRVQGDRETVFFDF